MCVNITGSSSCQCGCAGECKQYLLCMLIWIGPFNIIHQSPSKILLLGTESIPLFCVASEHSLDIQYKWNSVKKEIPGNSPVLWINSPGMYLCVITAGRYSCSHLYHDC